MENSCTPTQTLYSSRYGFVYRCNQCEYLQIEFGNFIIGYTIEAFQLFTDLVNSVDLQDEYLYHDHLTRKIVIQPVCSPGYYCFSGEEIMDLRDLLNGAIAMLELDDFLVRNLLKDNRNDTA